jgi:hypothetical protein
MQQVWKVSLLGRVGALVAVLVAAVVWYWIAGPMVGILVAGFGLALWFVAVLRPFVGLSDTELVVRNPRETRSVELSDIDNVSAGYGGLTVTTTIGPPLVIWAVQKSNLAKWTGRKTRADEVAAAINEAAESSRTPA